MSHPTAHLAFIHFFEKVPASVFPFPGNAAQNMRTPIASTQLVAALQKVVGVARESNSEHLTPLAFSWKELKSVVLHMGRLSQEGLGSQVSHPSIEDKTHLLFIHAAQLALPVCWLQIQQLLPIPAVLAHLPFHFMGDDDWQTSQPAALKLRTPIPPATGKWAQHEIGVGHGFFMCPSFQPI